MIEEKNKKQQIEREELTEEQLGHVSGGRIRRDTI